MKKFFLLAALVGVALTGCMKNEVYVPKCETPISFEVANYVAQTRVSGEFSKTETFGVDAWSYDATAGTVKIMSDEVVSYDDVDKQWTTTTKPYYWPINGTVDFIAYYPATSKPTTISYKYDGTDAITYTDYTVGSEDLMYADKAIRFSANNTAAGNDTALGYDGDYGFTGVPTLFHHALAKINFKVQNANPAENDGSGFTYEVIVKGITLNVYKQGSVTLTNEGTGTASRGTWKLPTDKVWEPTNDGALETLTWTGDVSLTDDTAVKYQDRIQYVLPQALVDGKQTITVDYAVIQRQNGTEISRKEDYSVTSELADWILQKWEMNKNITYTISIAKETTQILFAPAVEEWVDDASGSIVIENEAEKH